MIRRAFGQTRASVQTERYHPSYLPRIELVKLSQPSLSAQIYPSDRPLRRRANGSKSILLHGRDIAYFVAAPSDNIFNESSDLEFRLAIHRFAWLPSHVESIDDNDILRVWSWWCGAYLDQIDSWAWHPYTACERMLNILDVLETRRIAVLEDNLPSCIYRHVDCIYSRLEYFGVATGNHLTNNGRGLYRIGLAIGDENVIAIGLEILRQETARILDDQGFLREGSTHYQLLITQWLLDVWRSAVRGRRPEAQDLEIIASKTLSASRHLVMGKIYPFFGDISPDRHPSDLIDLVSQDNVSRNTWLKRLPEEDQQTIRTLPTSEDSYSTASSEWKKSEWAKWVFLTHVPHSGWNPIPGHGHQDLAGFELHRDGEIIVIDPGRGRYGETGASYAYRSALAHSVIEVDGAGPYPLNRALYSAAFREGLFENKLTCELDLSGTEWTLSHMGFSRLPGVGEAQRRWTWDRLRDCIVISDFVDGTRNRTVTRRLITPLRVENAPNGVKLIGQKGSYLVSGDSSVRIKPFSLWSAYGESKLGSCIEWTTKVRLPFNAALTISIA